MIDAVVPLLDAHLAAVRVAGIIEPGPLVRTDRLDDKREIILPLSYRISVPSRIGILRNLPPVFPYDAPYLLVLIQHEHFAGSLNDLKRPQFKQQIARESSRIATVKRIVH